MVTDEREAVVHFRSFGKYDVVRKLSRSLTDVYLARDVEQNRLVVLKLIEHSRDEFTGLVIEAETRGAVIQRQLHAADQRILEIYDCGERSGCFFVAMEYFEGRTLAEILRTERRIEPRRAARFAAEICSQLKTLHSFVPDVDGRKTAVVHGDIKPSNIQIGANDEVRLLDFGIAKLITFTHNLTHHNLGSPSYCSPERLDNGQVDQHADLWALGVSLYEMIAGAPPYQAQSTRKLENLIQARRPPRALPENCPAPLKAIISKALAGDCERRYHAAGAFEADLRAFLDNRQTDAEQEHAGIENERATAEVHADKPTVVKTGNARPFPAPKKTALTVRATRRDLRTALLTALLSGILVGLILFLPAAYYFRLQAATRGLREPRDYAHESLSAIAADWTLYQQLKDGNRIPGRLSPLFAVEKAMHANFVRAADSIIDGYRNNSDAQLSDFDWAKAQICLRHALDIDPADAKAKGKLALCEGYLNLATNPKLPKAALSIDNFRQAESYLDRSPDPHLGLARVYVYAFRNIGEAMSEFHLAQQLGYRLGPREIEQRADGYLFRAEWEMAQARRTPETDQQEARKWLEMARDDIERARSLYQPILGYANVSANLKHLYKDRSEQKALAVAYMPAVAPKPKPKRRYLSSRRWQ